jgi:hypothetical protein
MLKASLKDLRILFSEPWIAGQRTTNLKGELPTDRGQIMAAAGAQF